jgi:hypothetical protein
MTAVSGLRTARLAGCLLGVGLAALLVLASRPAAGGEAVGAAVSAYANQTGELAIDPAGPTDFLHAGELRPGGLASGSFWVTNQTGRGEAMRLAAVPSAHDLDGSLRVEIRSGTRTLASGLLGSLAQGAGNLLVLGPGESAKVAVTVSLSRDVGPDVAAALVEIAIVFKTGAPGTNGGIAA